MCTENYSFMVTAQYTCIAGVALSRLKVVLNAYYLFIQYIVTAFRIRNRISANRRTTNAPARFRPPACLPVRICILLVPSAELVFVRRWNQRCIKLRFIALTPSSLAVRK